MLFNALILWFCLDFSAAGDRPIAESIFGKIRGKWLGNVAAFQGIPYASPPIGQLRFKRPKLVEPWGDSVLSAEEYSAACEQISLKSQETSEDCLYLNVFTPNLEQLYPVLVWLHGGSHSAGSAADFPAESVAKLAEQGVVVVTLNFRLNFFGFFTTSTAEFPGNLGLWDQLEALRWVQQTIVAFGGDKTRVTLGGHGTGASMASLHSYSPHSKGLFSQMILQSGSALVPFGVSGNRYNLESSKVMAVNLGCISAAEWEKKSFNESFSDCIRRQSKGHIWNTWIEHFSSGSGYDPFFQTVWSPVVDGDFLPQSPAVISKKKRTFPKGFKVIIGSTNAESAQLVISKMRHSNKTLLDFGEEDLDHMLATLARAEAFPGKFRAVRNLVKFIYFQQLPIGKEHHAAWVNAIIEAASDYWMNAGIAAEADSLEQNGAEVFMYSFDYISPSLAQFLPYKAALHGIDLLFLIPGIESLLHEFGLTDWKFSSEDARVADLMQRTWTDFIKSKESFKPSKHHSSRWDAYNSTSNVFLRIITRPVMSHNFHASGANLWNKVVPIILDLPYCEQNNNEQYAFKPQVLVVEQQYNIYFALMWIFFALLLTMSIVLAIVIYHFKQRLKSYDLLRRVEELSFI